MRIWTDLREEVKLYLREQLDRGHSVTMAELGQVYGVSVADHFPIEGVETAPDGAVWLAGV